MLNAYNFSDGFDSLALPLHDLLIGKSLSEPIVSERLDNNLPANSSQFGENSLSGYSGESGRAKINNFSRSFNEVFKDKFDAGEMSVGRWNQLHESRRSSDAIALDSQLTKFDNGSALAGAESFGNQALSAEMPPLAEASDLADELVAYLAFEETSGKKAADSSPFGNENTGELHNGAKFVNGKFGSQTAGVVNLDGSGDYVHIKNSADINLGIHAERTISLWFNLDDASSKQVIYEEGGTVRGLNIYAEDGKLYAGGWNQPDSESGWQGTFLATDAIASKTWHHVALVLDAEAHQDTVQSQALSLYLDGVKIGAGEGSKLWSHSDNIGVGAIRGNTRFHNGVGKGTGSKSVAGSIDELKIYNRALSSSEIASLASPPQPVQVGTNLHGIFNWSPQIPFIDLFKTAKQWMPQKEAEPGDWRTGVWDTKEYDQLDLDESGWVKSLPAPEDPLKYTHVGTVIHKGIGNYPGGEYIVLYDGEGTIEYGFDARQDREASAPGRDVLDVSPSDSGIYVKITETDPNQTGNYIRNIRVVPAADEATYATEIFNPDFVEKIDDFEVLRFMDWMDTNHSGQKEWSDRPTPETATFSTHGVSVEHMVELANLLDTDPWFTIPHRATDEYVTQFAQYVKDNLDSDLEVYVEYSNEVWNSKFEQHRWVGEQAKQEWSNSNDNDSLKRINWFSKRTAEIAQQWDEVFGDEKERVIGVMGAQASNVWSAKKALEYSWTSNTSHQDNGIDAIAIAPYFGRYLGLPNHRKEVESWLAEPDGGLDKLFDEITQGGLLKNAPEGGALAQTYDWIESYAELAEKENLELIAYEGGQHLVGTSGVQNNQAITELFIEANRDSRMGEIYKEYLAKWFELGGNTFVNFSDVSTPSKWGSWGALEHINQAGSPKYDALTEFIASSNSPSAV